MKALIRRGKGAAHPVLHALDVELNTLEQTVRRAGVFVDLSPTEYRILEYLIHHPRKIASKQELLEHLYDFTWEHHSNVIEAHISNLRKKLEGRTTGSFARDRDYARSRVQAGGRTGAGAMSAHDTGPLVGLAAKQNIGSQKLKRSNSIAFRLIAAVLAVELLSAVLVILLAWGYERHTHFRAFNIMLRGRADSVLGAVQDAEDLGDNMMLELADLHFPKDDAYEVWDGRGHLLGRSNNWQGSAGLKAPQVDGITRIEVDGRQFECCA